MKVSFTDILKNEMWSEQEKGWAYDWLKTHKVNIKSLEIGGVEIDSSKFKIDDTNGIIYWLGKGKPEHVTLTIEYEESTASIPAYLQRNVILLLSLIVVGGSLIFYLGKASAQSKATKEMKELTTEIVGLGKEKDSLISVIDSVSTLSCPDSIQSSIKALRESLNTCQEEIENKPSSRPDTCNNALNLIKKLKEEIDSLRSSIPKAPNFEGISARIFCKTDTTWRSERVQKAIEFLVKAKIKYKRANRPTPRRDIGKIMFRTNNSALVEYLHSVFQCENFIIQETSDLPQESIDIYIE